MHTTLRIATPEGRSVELCHEIAWETSPVEGRDYRLYPQYDLCGHVTKLEQWLAGNTMKCSVEMIANRTYEENDLPHVVKRLKEHGWVSATHPGIDD